VKLLGEGSFSQVALAQDRETQQQVALKRIPDVLNSLENAKRVLREVSGGGDRWLPGSAAMRVMAERRAPRLVAAGRSSWWPPRTRPLSLCRHPRRPRRRTTAPR